MLVMDNLNTHHPASLYEAFEPMEARRIAQRLEIHYTPKHGSWLNIAEIELGVLARQCLDRRIPRQGRAKPEHGKSRNREAIRLALPAQAAQCGHLAAAPRTPGLPRLPKAHPTLWHLLDSQGVRCSCPH